jgi:crotonobetainyl-CoA:carnitine CoA-transferase CaiB-like acyl-CoA transferase
MLQTGKGAQDRAHSTAEPETNGDGNARPVFEGIRIVDLSQVAAGPYGISLMGDMGADVIKVEPPKGEPFRTIDNLIAPGESGYFYGINRSKRSITLNLSTDEGRSILDELVRTADVFVLAFRPDAVERMGLGYDRLSKINPDLLYCQITAFGETGPLAKDPGMDILAQALSGVMGMTGEPDRPPVKVGPPIADFVVSFLAAFAIASALRVRDRDGVAQKVSLNLLDGQFATIANYVTPYLLSGEPIQRAGGGHPQVVPYQVFAASDGDMIVACLSDRFWPPLCEAIDRPDLVDHPHFATNPLRNRYREELIPILVDLFKTATRNEWIERLRAHSVPCSRVNNLEQAIEEEQILHNGMLTELEHPVFGKYKVVNNPIKMTATPPVPFGYAPMLGEHNAEVLAEFGYTAEDLERLKQDGVI